MIFYKRTTTMKRSGAMGSEQISGIIEIVLGVLGLIVAILWIVLPFVVIGIKRRMDRVTELLAINNEMALETNRSLNKLASEVESSLKS
jgi:hypothetical protein